MKVNSTIIRLIFWWFVIFLTALAIPAGVQMYFKIASGETPLSLQSVAVLMRISAMLAGLSAIPLVAGVWQIWKLNRPKS